VLELDAEQDFLVGFDGYPSGMDEPIEAVQEVAEDDATGDHQQVEHLVVAEGAWERVRSAQRVDHAAHDVEQRPVDDGDDRLVR
jgi:hypothetical protein